MANKEVRDILVGRIVRHDETRWTAAPAGTKFHFNGLRDGEGDVRLFGVTHVVRRYQMEDGASSHALSSVEMALHAMGKPLWLASMPEAKACFYAPNWIAPVVLTAEQEDESLRLTAYSGRTLFGHLRCRIALGILERRLPEGLCSAKKGKAAEESESSRKDTEHHGSKQEQDTSRGERQKSPSKAAGKRAEPPKQKTAPKRLRK